MNKYAYSHILRAPFRSALLLDMMRSSRIPFSPHSKSHNHDFINHVCNRDLPSSFLALIFLSPLLFPPSALFLPSLTPTPTTSPPTPTVPQQATPFRSQLRSQRLPCSQPKQMRPTRHLPYSLSPSQLCYLPYLIPCWLVQLSPTK